MTKAAEVSVAPCLLIPTQRSVPPLLWDFGVSPSQAAKWRPDRNNEASRHTRRDRACRDRAYTAGMRSSGSTGSGRDGRPRQHVRVSAARRRSSCAVPVMLFPWVVSDFALIDAIECGIVSAQGAGGVRLAIEALHEGQESLPMSARFALQGLVSQLRSIEAEIEKIEAEILKWHRSNEASRRLATINAARTTGAGGKALGGPSTMIDHLLEWRTQSTFR